MVAVRNAADSARLFDTVAIDAIVVAATPSMMATYFRFSLVLWFMFTIVPACKVF